MLQHYGVQNTIQTTLFALSIWNSSERILVTNMGSDSSEECEMEKRYQEIWDETMTGDCAWNLINRITIDTDGLLFTFEPTDVLDEESQPSN